MRAVDVQRSSEGMDEVQVRGRDVCRCGGAVERIVEGVARLKGHEVAEIGVHDRLDAWVPAIVAGPQGLVGALHRDILDAGDGNSHLLRERRTGCDGEQKSREACGVFHWNLLSGGAGAEPAAERPAGEGLRTR